MSRAADLELASVVKRYGPSVAVDRISLKIKTGTYCCLLGPSGCGKTSTLRMIAGHENVSEGAIMIANKEVGDTPLADRGTAMMFQNYALFPHLTAIDNVAFSLRMKGIGKAQRQARAREVLRLVAMEATPSGCRRSFPAASSSASRWRGRSSRPQILLLDEPFPRSTRSCASACAPSSSASTSIRHLLYPCDPQPGRGDGARRLDRGDE